MILEVRTYIIRTGMIRDFLDRVERQGFPIARRVLGGPLGYFTEDVGDLNRINHLWAYESMADRERRSAEIFAMPDWLAFIDAVLPLVGRMETRLLRPASFSPLPLAAVRALNRPA